LTSSLFRQYTTRAETVLPESRPRLQHVKLVFSIGQELDDEIVSVCTAPNHTCPIINHHTTRKRQKVV